MVVGISHNLKGFIFAIAYAISVDETVKAFATGVFSRAIRAIINRTFDAGCIVLSLIICLLDFVVSSGAYTHRF